MKALMMATIATAVLGALIAATPARADEDCDNVITALEEAQKVALKTVEETMEEIKKATQGADDKKRAAVRNTYCSVSGEFLGTSRAFRAVMAQCLKGSKRAEALASFDKSIKQMETKIADTCK